MNDVIALNDFEFDTIIGILDAEQRAPQRIRVDLEMALPLEGTGRTGHLDQSVNYADVQAWVMTLAQQGRWRLLESLIHAIARLLLADPAPCEARGAIHAVDLRIHKLQILEDAVPSVRIRRDRGWCELGEAQVAPGVRRGCLEATPVQGAWRLVLDAGARWTVPAGQALHVLGGSGVLTQQGLGERGIGHGDRVARAPGRGVVAGEGGLALIAVGDPSA